jgi:hypothetical protein
LINEQSLSDAEMTAAGFKALKLGKSSVMRPIAGLFLLLLKA